MSWLQEVRGIDPDTASLYGVRVGPLRNGGEALAIAYRRGGETYGNKVRPLDPGDGPRFFFTPKGAPRDLWNVDVLKDEALYETPLIITEGEIDALSCIEAGFPRAVSIPDGWSLNYEGGDGPKSKPITDNAPLLRRSPFVILAGDSDPTGQSFVRAMNNLLDHPCKFLRYPDGCKDANDVLAKHGAGELRRVIERAEWIDPEGGRITGFTDLPPQPMGEVFRPEIEPLDRAIVFHTGFPTIVTGVPSHGKSTLLRVALWSAQRKHGVRVALGMFENPAYDTRDHLARLDTGRPWENLARVERDRLAEALDQKWRLLHMQDTEDRDHDMGWLRDMMRAAAVRDGCRIIVLDPWNEIEHMPAPGESMTQYTNVALAKIRQWAERFDCSVVIVAHPTKMRAEPGQQPKPPLGYDISDSAAWFNKAACGVTVHRVENDDPHTEIITWKSKFEQRYGFGRGRVKVDFDDRQMIYRGRLHG